VERARAREIERPRARARERERGRERKVTYAQTQTPTPTPTHTCQDADDEGRAAADAKSHHRHRVAAHIHVTHMYSAACSQIHKQIHKRIPETESTDTSTQTHRYVYKDACDVDARAPGCRSNTSAQQSESQQVRRVPFRRFAPMCMLRLSLPTAGPLQPTVCVCVRARACTGRCI